MVVNYLSAYGGIVPVKVLEINHHDLPLSWHDGRAEFKFFTVKVGNRWNVFEFWSGRKIGAEGKTRGEALRKLDEAIKRMMDEQTIPWLMAGIVRAVTQDGLANW